VSAFCRGAKTLEKLFCREQSQNREQDRPQNLMPNNCQASINTTEREEIECLFSELQKQPKSKFPQLGKRLDAPKDRHGVYVIRNSSGLVEHVGRTLRGKKSLFQRLGNHLGGISSFMETHHSGNGRVLRDGYTFQFLAVDNDRQRALLEYYATAWHCPVHLGLGLASDKKET
jgi:hypothetical protein